MFKKSLFVSLFIILEVVVSQNLAAQSRPKDKLLHQKVFVITMEHQSEKKNKQRDPFEDELSFRSNKGWSKVMQNASNGGFVRGDYAVKKEEVLGEKVYKFQIINKNSKGFSLKWDGEVFGDQIKGTATISKKGKVKEEYAFTGALKD
jgi:hypothetical protein